MPSTHFSASTLDAFASSAIDCSIAYAMTGIITFSSKKLPVPPNVIVA